MNLLHITVIYISIDILTFILIFVWLYITCLGFTVCVFFMETWLSESDMHRSVLIGVAALLAAMGEQDRHPKIQLHCISML